MFLFNNKPDFAWKIPLLVRNLCYGNHSISLNCMASFHVSTFNTFLFVCMFSEFSKRPFRRTDLICGMLLNCVTVSPKPFVCINYIRESSQEYAATHSVITFASTLLLQLCTLSHRDLSLYTAKASAAIESNVEEALERLSESFDELYEEYPDANVFERLLHAAFAAATSCVVCSNPKLPHWQPFLHVPTSSNASNAFVAHAPIALYLLHSLTNAIGDANVTGIPHNFSADYTQLALGAVLNMHLGRKSATSASTRTSTSSASTSTTAPALPLRPETRALSADATSAPASGRNSPNAQHPDSDAASSFAGGTLPEQEGDEALEDRDEDAEEDALSRPQSAVASRAKSFALNEDGTFSGQDLLKLLDAKQHARTVRRLLSAGLLRNHSADKPLVETFDKLDKYTQYTVWVRVSPIDCRNLLMASRGVQIYAYWLQIQYTV